MWRVASSNVLTTAAVATCRHQLLRWARGHPSGPLGFDAAAAVRSARTRRSVPPPGPMRAGASSLVASAHSNGAGAATTTWRTMAQVHLRESGVTGVNATSACRYWSAASGGGALALASSERSPGWKLLLGAARSGGGVKPTGEKMVGWPRRVAGGGRSYGYYNNNWTPPRHRRPPPAMPRMDGESMMWTLIGANAFIFACWHAVDPRVMHYNFAVSEESVYNNRIHTVVTSAFSHYDLGHFATNMIALYYFGRDVGQLMGAAYLLNLYLVGGVVASLTHVAWCRYQRERRQHRRRGYIMQQAGRWMENTAGYLTTPPALGASGAVNAIVLFNALVFPTRTVLLYFFIPMPTIMIAGLFLARDLYGARMGLGASSTGHAAHLGGAAVGAAAWTAMRFRLFRRFRG